MKRRITGFILGTMLLALSVPAQAQQAKKTPRIGFLMPGSRPTYSMRIEAFRNGLRELGYNEGQNIAIEWRFAEGKSDRLAGLAADLVRSKVDVIVTSTTPVTQAALQATRTIPIVMAAAPIRLEPDWSLVWHVRAAISRDCLCLVRTRMERRWKFSRRRCPRSRE